MKLYPTNLKWKNWPIWIEAENDKAAEGLEYFSSIEKPMLTPHKTEAEPIEVKSDE